MSRADVPFPLFAPPLATASGYAGAGQCDLCGEESGDLLELGIGADVVYSCPCGAQFAVPAEDHGAMAAPCPGCGAAVSLLELSEEPATCVGCLQRGRAALTQDTEYGMVRWEDAVRGRTHGRPALRQVAAGFALLPATDSGWIPVQVPPEVLLELVRTPTYGTIQGEQWLFCCADVMTFLGEWTRLDFAAEYPADPAGGFGQVIEDAEPWMWEHVPEPADVADAEWGFYVFRCGSCGRTRGHYDMF